MLKELDYMGGTRLDAGIMMNPKDPAITILRDMHKLLLGLKKFMDAVIAEISILQGNGRDVTDMDDDARRDCKRRRGGRHGVEQEESRGGG